MPPGLGRVAIAAIGAAFVAAGAVVAFREVLVGVVFVLGGAVLLLWSIRRP
jgi:hypothetical protein